jgi:hypothetical protein
LVLGDSTVFSLAGCHTSSAFDLSRCSTVTYNTILGLSLRDLSRHVLPHAALGFFAGRGSAGWWSSSNFASILLASRDDTSSLYSGGRTQSQGVTILSTRVAKVFFLDLASWRGLGAYLAKELSIGGHSPHSWCGVLIRILLARGSRGLCPLPAVLAHLPQD